MAREKKDMRFKLLSFYMLLFSPSFFSVHCASLSPTSRQYACGFADSSIHVWSQLPGGASTGHMTRIQPIGLPDDSAHHRLIGHSGPVYSTCFNANGKFLVSGSEDTTAQLWNLERYTSVVSYSGHTYPIWDISFRYGKLYLILSFQ